jgi:hypothetical protein
MVLGDAELPGLGRQGIVRGGTAIDLKHQIEQFPLLRGLPLANDAFMKKISARMDPFRQQFQQPLEKGHNAPDPGRMIKGLTENTRGNGLRYLAMEPIEPPISMAGHIPRADKPYTFTICKSDPQHGIGAGFFYIRLMVPDHARHQAPVAGSQAVAPVVTR